MPLIWAIRVPAALVPGQILALDLSLMHIFLQGPEPRGWGRPVPVPVLAKVLLKILPFKRTPRRAEEGSKYLST